MNGKKRDCEIYGYTIREVVFEDGSKCYIKTPNYPPERVKKCFDNFFQTVANYVVQNEIKKLAQNKKDVT